MCCGGNISHVWPVHSITGRGCFSGLYIITHVLFIFLRSMVMQRGGASKMDATGRLTYRLPNRDKEESRTPRSPRLKCGRSRFHSARLRRPSVVPLLCLKFTPPSQNCRFSSTKRLILCLIEGDKWKVGSRGRLARDFLETTSSSGSREAAAAGPHRWPRIWIRSAVPSDNRPD